jgi:hypothetical protein
MSFSRRPARRGPKPGQVELDGSDVTVDGTAVIGACVAECTAGPPTGFPPT